MIMSSSGSRTNWTTGTSPTMVLMRAKSWQNAMISASEYSYRSPKPGVAQRLRRLFENFVGNIQLKRSLLGKTEEFIGHAAGIQIEQGAHEHGRVEYRLRHASSSCGETPSPCRRSLLLLSCRSCSDRA